MKVHRHPKGEPVVSPGSSIPGEATRLELLSSIIENAPIPIFLKDAEGVYFYINEAYAQQEGINPDAILGKTDADVYPPATAAAFQSEDRLVLKAEGPMQSSWPVEVDGEQRMFRTIKFPIQGEGDGEVLGVCGISLDITDTLLEQKGRATERARVIAAKPFERLLATLTTQEERVAELLVSGLSDRQIARSMNLADDTVRHHVSRVLKKLRKQSRTQAVIEMLKFRKRD
jgi:rsbT co-antagonist protein RsbR